MEVAVLRGTVHGRPVTEYAAALRDRVEAHDVERVAVTLARTPEAERAALARS